jgi:pimeloyl-ACP methyl ester carboxylesterase
MIQETVSFVEFGRLVVDPVFRGVDLPRGDGRPVVVIPGLFGNDLYLEAMRGWLRRIGYRPIRSTLAINAGCPRRLRDQIQAEIIRRLDGAAGPVAIIGHSRGGVIAWTIAVQMREQVSHLALLGSPIGAYRHAVESGDDLGSPTPIGRILGRASTFARRMLDPDCNVPACGCAFIQDVMRPLSPATALMVIVSRDDQVVAQKSAELGEGQTIEVGGGHAGLVVNREVYRTLAHFLIAKKT